VLKLDHMIIKAPNTYKDLIPARVEFDTTEQKVTVLYGLATVTPLEVTSGTIDISNPQTPPQFRRAPVVWQMTIAQPDLTALEPALTQLMEDLFIMLEQIDQMVVDQQDEPGGIATTPWVDGEESHSLACTFETFGDRELTLRVKGPEVIHHRE
jgi:hypothetical protein